MARGDIYLDSQFPYYNGSIGKKLFVVLNEPINVEPYLVVKTTSQLKSRIYAKGCNPQSGVFYIPVSSGSWFEEDTLIQLLEIHEFSQEEFLKGTLSDKVIVFKETLPSQIVAQIINCVRKLKQDVSEKHFKMVTR